MKKQNTFKTPEAYFDTLKDRLMEAVEQERAAFPDKEGFTVPEGYFDSVSEKVLKKAPRKNPIVVQLYPYKNIIYAVSSAAAVVLLVFGLQYQPSDSVSFDTLASAEIVDYLSYETADLNTYEIGIDDEMYNEVLDENLEEENIMNYLDDSIDDLDDLNFEIDE